MITSATLWPPLGHPLQSGYDAALRAENDGRKNMAFLRKRASGNYALSWKWKGNFCIKGLGTADLAEAEQIKQEAVDQLARVRRGESDGFP